MKGINNMDKYSTQDHIVVLSELTTLLDLRNETQIKINAKNKELAKIEKAKEVEDEIPF